MKQIFAILAVLSLFTLTGCGNLSPRMNEKINNQGGKIEDMNSLQNSMQNRIGNLEAHNKIQDSKIGQLQEGYLNLQSNYQNSGVQILSGPGGIIVAVLGLVAGVVIASYFRSQAVRHEQASDILAEKIVQQNDPYLEDEVFKSAMYTNAEDIVLDVMAKHQHRFIRSQAQLAEAMASHSHTES